ncbi:MAG: CsgG/HfaB family protein [Nitrospinales bacterium]
MRDKRQVRRHVLPPAAVLLVVCWAALAFFPRMMEAREAGAPRVYEVAAETDVFGQNFVKARKKAVAAALQEAVKFSLQETLGEETYQLNLRLLQKIISRAKRYVRGYRFLEAQDNSDENVVSVRLEVTLFNEALRKQLQTLGILTGPGAEGVVAIVIKETSFSSPREAGFWDFMPFSEAALSQRFADAGFHVVERDTLRGLVSEEMISNAVHGDMEAAANIGRKTGADMVIVGSAVSALSPEASEMGLKIIRANISLKAVSVLNSVIIAAKSDFAAAEGEDILTGEQKAFRKASAKLGGFLIDSIQRFRNKEPETEAPRPGVSQSPALPMTDL